MSQLHRRPALLLRRRRGEEAMTLIEIMIVIVIMALIGTGVTLALLPSLERARIRDTESAVQTVRGAAIQFRAENPGDGCPSIDDLAEQQYLDSGRRLQDAWEQDFEIACEGRDIIVTSPGPDGQFGNEDDIS